MSCSSEIFFVRMILNFGIFYHFGLHAQSLNDGLFLSQNVQLEPLIPFLTIQAFFSSTCLVILSRSFYTFDFCLKTNRCQQIMGLVWSMLKRVFTGYPALLFGCFCKRVGLPWHNFRYFDLDSKETLFGAFESSKATQPRMQSKAKHQTRIPILLPMAFLLREDINMPEENQSIDQCQ